MQAIAKHRCMDTLASIPYPSLDGMPVLGDDEIHVWHMRADGGSRELATAVRTALQRLLCRYANLAPIPAIERGLHGKPFVSSLPWLDFNLSHSGSRAVLAFARGQPLGIDIEERERTLSYLGLARRFFSPAEAMVLERLPKPRLGPAFLDLWTHKEAVLKALGAGLQFGLARVEFALDDDGSVRSLARIAAEGGAGAEWKLWRLDPGPGAFGALAWRGPARVVRSFMLG
jgi:4'-phosphopantetheinyl transferase